MSAAELVANVFDTWGKGGYNSDDALKTCQEHFAPDCTLDSASDMEFKKTDLNKVYTGPAGVVEFCRRLADYDYANFTPEIVPLSDDKCLVKASFKPTSKVSGKTSDTTYVEYHEWTVKDGKITSCKIAPTCASEFDAIHLSPEEATGIVGSVLAAWGAGKFSDSSSKEAKDLFASLMTPDIVWEADGPMKNTDGYKTYTGEKGIFEWVKFLEGMEFPDHTIVGMTVLAGDVIVSVSYTPTVKATGKTAPTKLYDLQKWSILGGKINKVKLFFGNPAVLDELFAA
jgi:ketosteroid isomerase-like protein